jgi:prepilin-type N-terminal cleavage/methylation domain-containing protein
MKKDAGFSLIELVVVVAILAVMTTGVMVSVYTSASYNAKQVAQEIDSALTECRVQALSKTDAWMQIAYDDSLKKYVIKTSYATDQVLSGSNRVTISYTKPNDDGSDVETVELTGSNTLTLKYNRSSGAFLPIVEDGAKYCSSILISSGSKTCEITLSQLTGRHTLRQ